MFVHAHGSICVRHMFTRRGFVCSWLIGSSTHKHTRSFKEAMSSSHRLILPATLFHLTSSILRPVVTFKLQSNYPCHSAAELYGVFCFFFLSLNFSSSQQVGIPLLISWLKYTLCIFLFLSYFYSLHKTA